jgi:hypothetical protein
MTTFRSRRVRPWPAASLSSSVSRPAQPATPGHSSLTRATPRRILTADPCSAGRAKSRGGLTAMRDCRTPDAAWGPGRAGVWVWGAFIRSGALAASVRAARSRSKPTLACSPRVPSRAGNDRPRESGRPPRSKARSSFGTPQATRRSRLPFRLTASVGDGRLPPRQGGRRALGVRPKAAYRPSAALRTLNHPQGKGREKDVAQKTALFYGRRELARV